MDTNLTPQAPRHAAPALMSFLIPGFGQFVKGNTFKGVLHFGLAFIGGLCSFGILWFVVAAFSARNAYKQ